MRPVHLMPLFRTAPVLKTLTAALLLLGVLTGCTAVVVDEPYVYRPTPPPPAVIVLPGETYGAPPPDRNRVNRRLSVCTANYNNCMASCNAFANPSQRALCVSQCNAAMQQCRSRSLE
ncbi:MAG: hypothetical protein LDL30_10340 [Desulfovibrio sp.]|nr:hypothetical protein [Desulfovibrio sp.]MCA1985190.1 hypothetical protein [Desulfovibrio sp.]